MAPPTARSFECCHKCNNTSLLLLQALHIIGRFRTSVLQLFEQPPKVNLNTSVQNRLFGVRQELMNLYNDMNRLFRTMYKTTDLEFGKKNEHCVQCVVQNYF